MCDTASPRSLIVSRVGTLPPSWAMAGTTANEKDYRWDGEEQSLQHWLSIVRNHACSRAGGAPLRPFLAGLLGEPLSAATESVTASELSDPTVWGTSPLEILGSHGEEATVEQSESSRTTASNTTRSSSRSIAPKIKWDTLPKESQLLDAELYSWLCRLVPANKGMLVAYPGTLALHSHSLCSRTRC